MKMVDSDSDDDLFTFAAPKPVFQSKRPKFGSSEYSGNLGDDNEEFVLSDDEETYKRTSRLPGSKAANLLRSLKHKCSESEDAERNKAEIIQSPVKQTRRRNEISDLSSDSEDDSIQRMMSPAIQTDNTAATSSVVNNSKALLYNLRSSKVLSSNSFSNSMLLEDSPLEPKSRLTLRIRISGETYRLPIDKNEQFLGVIVQLASIIGVDAGRILLTHNTVTLRPEDTPEKLSISTTDFIDGVILTEALPQDKNDEGANYVLVKVQSQKHSQKYRISKEDSLGKIMDKFAESLNIPINKILFQFDGDTVKVSDTAEMLGLEDEDTIDARVKT